MLSFRPLIFSLLLVLSGPSLAADCAMDGLQAFPTPGSVLPTNARIILEGLGSEQLRVATLLSREFKLKAKDDEVAVRVLRGWKSARNRVAVVLRPRALLKANRSYHLVVGNALPGFRLLNGDEPVWHTGKGSDDRSPKWIDRPNVAEGLYDNKGGGLTRLLKFRLKLDEQSPAYLVVTMRRSRGPSNTQSYFVPISGREAVIGHDTCSGSFDFEDGKAYRAVVEAYDVAGNQARRVPPVDFLAPRQVYR